MQDDPIAASPRRRPAHPPPPHLQRWLLLNSSPTPRPTATISSTWTRTLKEQRLHVEAAVDDLVGDGLAERDGDQVRASTAAWRFDALWPARA